MTSVTTLQGDEADLVISRENRIYQLARDYAGKDPVKWKRITAVILRRVCGFNLSQIALFLNDHKGHVSRQIRQAEDELRGERKDPQLSLFD